MRLHSRALNFLGAISLSMTDKMSRRIEDKTRLGHVHAAALIQIGMNPDANMLHLQRMTGFSQPNTSRAVDYLVRERLVTRKRGLTNDSRETVLNLTKAGNRVMQRALNARYEVLEQALADLSETEHDALEALLEKILPYTVQDIADADIICRLCDYTGCPLDRCPAEQCFLEEAAIRLPESQTATRSGKKKDAYGQ